MFTIRHLINSLQADSSRGYWASAFCCRLDDQHLQTMGQKNEEIMEYVTRFCTRRFPLNEKNKPVCLWKDPEARVLSQQRQLSRHGWYEPVGVTCAQSHPGNADQRKEMCGALKNFSGS